MTIRDRVLCWIVGILLMIAAVIITPAYYSDGAIIVCSFLGGVFMCLAGFGGNKQ